MHIVNSALRFTAPDDIHVLALHIVHSLMEFSRSGLILVRGAYVIVKLIFWCNTFEVLCFQIECDRVSTYLRVRTSKNQYSLLILCQASRVTVPSLEYLFLIFILKKNGPSFRCHVEFPDNSHPSIILYTSKYN